MLPISSTYEDLYYPMAADIYYSVQTQSDLGEVTRSWVKDRTITCSAIKDRPDSNMSSAVTTQKFIEIEPRVNLRTKEDILVSASGTSYRITEVLITNIKDPAGTIVWKESVGVPTEFEIDNVEPIYNEFHNLDAYRILLCRSDEQGSV